MASIDLTPPWSVRLAYQTSQMATGTYTQGGSQVFSHLVRPPAGGLAAEEASDVAAQAVGVRDPWASDPAMRLMAYQNADLMRNFYDSASGNHFP